MKLNWNIKNHKNNYIRYKNVNNINRLLFFRDFTDSNI